MSMKIIKNAISFYSFAKLSGLFTAVVFLDDWKLEQNRCVKICIKKFNIIF